MPGLRVRPFPSRVFRRGYRGAASISRVVLSQPLVPTDYSHSHFHPRPTLLSGELGAKIFVIISFCRVGLGDGLGGWTGIAIQQAAVRTGHDRGRIIL